MNLLMDALRRRSQQERQAEEAEREARIAEAAKWFRPVALAIYTNRPVSFVIVSNPWDAFGSWTGMCSVIYNGEQKDWEIISRAIERAMRKMCLSQDEAGEVRNLVGYECCVESFSHRTSITLLRGKTHGK
jgi:hypothetical protein